VPPLTRVLGRGVAVAEDPGDGRSFGESRCAAVAAGIATLLPDRLADDDDAVAEALGASLAAAGISPSRPYRAEASPAPDDEAWTW
jgi:hypothetical protein